MLFSVLKHYLDLYISDTALKVSRSLNCFTTSLFHGVENYFPGLWGSGISDAIFSQFKLGVSRWWRYTGIETILLKYCDHFHNQNVECQLI